MRPQQPIYRFPCQRLAADFGWLATEYQMDDMPEVHGIIARVAAAITLSTGLDPLAAFHRLRDRLDLLPVLPPRQLAHYATLEGLKIVAEHTDPPPMAAAAAA